MAIEIRKIINGKRYDTSKALLVGEHDHGSYPGSGDFSHWSAALYKTPRSGRFFLAGQGGAMTMFAQHLPDGGACGGERLIPMSTEDALEWAERYLLAEAIEEHFADMVEDA